MRFALATLQALACLAVRVAEIPVIGDGVHPLLLWSELLERVGECEILGYANAHWAAVGALVARRARNGDGLLDGGGS